MLPVACALFFLLRDTFYAELLLVSVLQGRGKEWPSSWTGNLPPLETSQSWYLYLPERRYV